MTLDKANINLKLDSRMLEYNLRVGNITKEEYQKYIATLPDLSSQVEKLTLDEGADSHDSADDQH